jgi:hypothetical protein
VELAKSALNWGSVPDWIAGLGSVLAFAAITFSLWREARLRRADQAETTNAMA